MAKEPFIKLGDVDPEARDDKHGSEIDVTAQEYLVPMEPAEEFEFSQDEPDTSTSDASLSEKISSAIDDLEAQDKLANFEIQE